MLEADINRFWSKVDKNGPILREELGACWQWTLCRDKDGYGFFKVQKKQVKAHRFCWSIVFGEISKSTYIMHKCDNPSCVNPSHLESGTVLENNRDCVKKGRNSRGEKNGHAVLTEELVLKLRSEYIPGSTTKGTVALARKYNVSQTAVYCAVKKKWWKHV